MSLILEPFARRPPAVEPPSLASVLTEVAETAAETLELQEVFDRVATAIHQLIPFDNMGVVRILDGQWTVLHATTVPCRDHEAECTEPLPLSSWSPRFRPRPGPIPHLEDAERELDPAFPMDADLLAWGIRSALWEPFRMAEGFSGGVWLCSYAPYAFTAEHQELLRPIAAILGSAVEHWRIWDTERRRRERLDRLDQLETLLGALAETLDVREVFAELSAAVQPVLPHDLLVLTELDLRARAIRFAAVAGEADIEVPTQSVSLTEEETRRRSQDFELVRDIQSEIRPTSERQRLLVASGMRSWLRVPVWLAGEVRAGLGFFHREAARYDRGDVEVATRIADRVALMLSHQRLAEEARIAAEVRERAERLEATVETLTRELEARGRGPVAGDSRLWRDVLRQVGRVASSETTVLITGESGTGKEVVAHLLPQGSRRSGKPFVAINCAALPEQLLESELFGHERGAFTGALSTKIGRLEQAAGGTLFLDEIGEMSPLVQAKLLRVLQEREFQRLGGTRTLRADVRVIAATNRDLAQAIARQQFREDLYYRLNVFGIHVPALRERAEDILLLAQTFLDELGPTMGRPAAGISRDAREWLLAYHWPGNVRELRNAIERAILLCDGGLITREHLPAVLSRSEPVSVEGRVTADVPLPAGGVDLEDVEKSFVERALRTARGNKSKAARLLGLTRAQLYSRLEKYSLGD
jgi:transcriptional regulator with GAF, ATPase, and Fis domain